MQYVKILKTLGNIDVIAGFKPAPIDYVSTRAAAHAWLANSAEYQDLIKKRASAVQRIYRQSKVPKTAAPRSSAAIERSYWAEVRQVIAPIDALLSGLHDQALENATIYHGLPNNLVLVTNAEYDDLRAKIDSCGAGQYVTAAGEILTDHRGTYYAEIAPGEWGEINVTDLGVVPPDGYVAGPGLSPESLASLHAYEIAQKPLEERESLAAAEVEGVQINAVKRLATALIESDDDAETVRMSVKTEARRAIAKIHKKYGVQQ